MSPGSAPQRSPQRKQGRQQPLLALRAQPNHLTQESRRMSKYVYFFGGGKADGRADMKNLLGGKGANLAEMANLGLPVPAGFTLVTDYCNVYLQQGRKFSDDLKQQVAEAMRK